MKKSRKVFISMASLSILFNNITYAATDVAEKSSEGISVKYIFMGVSAVVIVLLLFLGYKMDTRGDEVTQVSHKTEKTKKKLFQKAETMQKNAEVYEEDEQTYIDDGEIFDNDDLNDEVEYKSDEEEESLYSTENSEEDDNLEFSNGLEENEEMESEEGETFDTSVIDKLDDEELDNTNNSFEETMLFNNSDFSSTGKSLEDEIDDLDNIDVSDGINDDNNLNETDNLDSADNSNEVNNLDSINISNEINDLENMNNNPGIELIGDKEDDSSFIEELKKYEEPETSFKGFSVASNDESEDIKEDFNENSEIFETTEKSDIDNEFLSQMEENLQKSQENRKSKKSTKTTKTSKTSKSTSKKTTKKSKDK